MVNAPSPSFFAATPVSQRAYYALCTLPLAAAGIGALFAPICLGRFFTGPDHVLWVQPFCIWMGFAATTGLVLYPRLFPQNPGREAGLAFGIIVFLAALFLFVSVQRMASGLREAEAYAATMALRFAEGKPLFPDPETWPVGTIYSPFFAIVCGLLFKIIPSIYVCGRIVTISSTLLTAWFVYKTVRHLHRDKTTGLWAMALFFATYAVTGKSYDWMLVDPLCMCLVAASCLYFIRDKPFDPARSLFLAGLACFTKQSAVLPFMAITAYYLQKKRSRTVMLPLIFWVLAGIAIVYATDGWAWTYLVRMPSRHGFHVPEARVFLILFILQLPLWIGACLAFAKKQLPGGFTLAFGAVLVSSFLGICKGGGWINALFCLEPLLCIAAAGMLRRYPALLTVQFLCSVYNPFGTLYPFATVHAARKHAVEIARATSGAVWFPVETNLSYESKKREWDGYGALESYLWNGPPPPRRLLDAIADKKFDRIIICTRNDVLFWKLNPQITELVLRNYEPVIDSLLTMYRPVSEMPETRKSPQ